jgi:hypothetical protein
MSIDILKEVLSGKPPAVEDLTILEKNTYIDALTTAMLAYRDEKDAYSRMYCLVKITRYLRAIADTKVVVLEDADSIMRHAFLDNKLDLSQTTSQVLVDSLIELTEVFYNVKEISESSSAVMFASMNALLKYMHLIRDELDRRGEAL